MPLCERIKQVLLADSHVTAYRHPVIPVFGVSSGSKIHIYQASFAHLTPTLLRMPPMMGGVKLDANMYDWIMLRDLSEKIVHTLSW